MKIGKTFLLFGLAALLVGTCHAAAKLQTYEDVRLVDSGANDGDSFIVEADGKRMHLRLYYVDCPETSVNHDYDSRRLREQARYFGLKDARRALHYGKVAGEFTKGRLKEPFTIITSHAQALGAAGSDRIYAFVITSEGEYLDRLLVRAGLAQPKGVRRETPDNIHRDEMREQLRDMEAAAIWHRHGIWSETDPDHMVELRAQLREEERVLEQIGKAEVEYPLNINTATIEQLQSFDGIGDVLAKRIFAARPFDSLEELYDIKRMPDGVVDRIKSDLFVGGSRDTPVAK